MHTETIKDYAPLYLGCEILINGEIHKLESISTNGLIGDETRDESGEGWHDIQDCKLLNRERYCGG